MLISGAAYEGIAGCCQEVLSTYVYQCLALKDVEDLCLLAMCMKPLLRSRRYCNLLKQMAFFLKIIEREDYPFRIILLINLFARVLWLVFHELLPTMIELYTASYRMRGPIKKNMPGVSPQN